MDTVAIFEVHQASLAKLDQRSAMLSEREDRAKRALERCEAERRQIEREHEALVLAEQIYRRTLGLPTEITDAVFSGSGSKIDIEAGASKLRARIGPQRYRILVFLRENSNPGSIEDIAFRTGLPIRRIRDQINADLASGIISASADGFRLTSKGFDLLDRFETYKTSRNEPLPALAGPILDEPDEEEAEDGAGAEPDIIDEVEEDLVG